MDAYLRRTDVVDWDHPSIQALARDLKISAKGSLDFARRAFEWVRDTVEHSIDYRRGPVTWRASDVLAERTGFCYAKSHLLAAVLRVNGIPTGLCYQRVALDVGHGFCLHGLNAIHLPEFGWYRVDCRGNKPGVNAQFTPPHEQLAFSTDREGEAIFPEVWPDPLPSVLEALQTQPTWLAVATNLPDVEIAVGSRGQVGN